MNNSIWQKAMLLVAGLVALAISVSVLFFPQGFYGSSEITLEDNPTLLSEIRAPSMVLVVFGLVMLGATAMSQLRQSALIAASMLYLSYGGGRLVSLVLDGMPHSNIMFAMVIEVGIGLSCTYVLLRRSRWQGQTA